MSKKGMINRDIVKIKSTLDNTSTTYEELLNLHIEMDAKYQSCIKNWGTSMYNWIDNYGFDTRDIGIDSVKYNLKVMENKILAYSYDMNTPESVYRDNKVSVNQVVQNTNTITTDIKIEDVKNTIQNLESLTNEQTTEALKKIDEIKKIIDSKDSRKSKWEKAKNVLVWLADKSVDLGIAFLPLLLEITK